jgi:hypothetical protein
MKRSILAACALALTFTRLSASIGETPAQLEARFGRPLREAVESNGSGLRVYHSADFAEIRVLFINDTSEKEEYKYDGEPPIPPELVVAIRNENPGQEVFDATSLVVVYSKRGLATEDRLPNRDQLEHTYSGRVKIKRDGEWDRAILRDHDTVVEIPIFPLGYPQEFKLVDGVSYSVTVLDQDSEDINAVMAVISRREHADWHDCVNDAGVGGLQPLLRIVSGDAVLFDRSVCGLHHVKMEPRKVPVAYLHLSKMCCRM